MQRSELLKLFWMSRNNFLDRSAFWICGILLALLPFHAFLWTWFHSFFWQQDFTIIIQSWKEILVAILGILAFIKLITTRRFPNSRSFCLGTTFVALAVFYAFSGEKLEPQTILGLRTATLFLIAFLSLQFFAFGKNEIRQLKKIILLSSGAVIFFALAQKFLLPPDFLKYFGYSENVSSWLPGGNLPIYHLVGNSETIRLQSSFAGPNQLAAFLLVILPLAVFEFQKILRKDFLPTEVPRSWTKVGWQYFLGIEILGGVFVLIFTFSRSAWLGAAAIFLIFAVKMWRQNLSKKLKKKLFLGGILMIFGILILLFSSKNLGEIISRSGSTSEHFERSQEAFELVLEKPLGLGLGKTGGVAQRFEENPITPENTFLGIALELGWFGGILFLLFCAKLLFELHKNESPVFYSLAGILVIALFLHPLEDTPTALSLFLLAGVLNSPK